jgi:transposase-like protein
MPEIITVQQAAELAGVQRNAVYKWIKDAEENNIPVQYAGPHQRKVFDRQEFMDWFLNKHKKGVR